MDFGSDTDTEIAFRNFKSAMRNQNEMFLGVDHVMFHPGQHSSESEQSEDNENLDFTLNNANASNIEKPGVLSSFDKN